MILVLGFSSSATASEQFFKQFIFRKLFKKVKEITVLAFKLLSNLIRFLILI